MNREYVPYELALELQGLGFNEPCFGVYNTKNGNIRKGRVGEVGNAPLCQQVFRWFREKHGYNCFIPSTPDGKYYYFRENLNDRREDSEPELTDKFETYDEAELACLKKLIKLVKQKS